MYANPALLQPRSNREDFIETIGLYDDDTFAPINLTGTATASGQAFTSAAWNVTDGAIATASATSITIPAFPVGAQLSALALTVGAGLGILPGDPIKIADTATGLNTMAGYVVSYAAATGALVCQIGWTYQFEIRKLPPNWTPGTDYTSFYDFGTSSPSPVLSASLAAGTIQVIDMGVIQILIPEKTFRTLSSGTYGASLTMTDGVNTRQVFIGRLPVLHGGVSN
jgi:hypothetical protein